MKKLLSMILVQYVGCSVTSVQSIVSVCTNMATMHAILGSEPNSRSVQNNAGNIVTWYLMVDLD